MAKELEISQIIIPRHAGVFSAWSLLGQDLARSSARTVLEEFSDDGLGRANLVAGELLAALVENCRFLSIPSLSAPVRSVRLDVRYIGQEYPLTINASSGGGAIDITLAEIERRFLDASSRSYGYVRKAPLEIIAVRVEIRASLPRPKAKMPVSAVRDEKSSIEAFSFRANARLPFPIVPRDAMTLDHSYPGPMIITEKTTTTYVDQNWTAKIHPCGHLILQQQGAKS